jgi:hypothetical protein
MVTKIFNYECPKCNQKMCGISVTAEKMECAECGAICDFVGCEEEMRAIKSGVDHLDFKPNPKPECVLEGKKCAILNQTKDVCVRELEPEEIRDITSNEIKTIRKFSIKPCGNEDVEPELYEEAIE